MHLRPDQPIGVNQQDDRDQAAMSLGAFASRFVSGFNEAIRQPRSAGHSDPTAVETVRPQHVKDLIPATLSYSVTLLSGHPLGTIEQHGWEPKEDDPYQGRLSIADPPDRRTDCAVQ